MTPDPRALLDRVVEALPGAVRGVVARGEAGAVISDAGRILAANGYFYDLVAAEPAVRAGRPLSWMGLTPPEFLARDAAAIGRARAIGVSDVYEKDYEWPDRSRVAIVVACGLVSPEPLPLFALVARADDRVAREAVTAWVAHPDADLRHRVSRSD